jgi:hypothetical protein
VSGANFLVMAVSSQVLNGGFCVLTVSDSEGGSASNTWTKLSSYAPPSPNWTTIYYAENPTHIGPNHTFTASGGNGPNCYVSFSAMAFSGVLPGGSFDVGTDVGSNTATPGTVTPGSGYQLIVTVLSIGTQTNSQPAIGGGFTITDTVSNLPGLAYGIAAAYLIQTSGAPVSPVWTMTGGTPSPSSAAAFAGM